MRRAALALCALAGLLVALPGAVPAQAAAPLLTDPKGDARVLGDGFDIVSATLTTKGTTKKVGKKTVYTPTKLIASLTMSGPVSTQAGTHIAFSADTGSCRGGYFEWRYHPGQQVINEGSMYGSTCGEPDATGSGEFFDEAAPVVKGNTITWTLPLKSMGDLIEVGDSFRNFEARSDVVEPATGIVGTELAPSSAAIDSAVSKTFWELG